LAITVSMITRTLASPFSTMRAESGGIWMAEHFPHQRFSRLLTRTNHLAGSRSNASLKS
jgi:hypothetical protein